MTTNLDLLAAEERFRSVFSHLGAVAAYARRRGHADAEAAAAEVMTIAWRRLADVPRDDPRPWLFATARNVVLADRRRTRAVLASLDTASETQVLELDPELEAALRSLSRTSIAKRFSSSPGKT
jgi:DNA-directed RNA polymerase specialized sigma24 family protein